MKKPVLTVPDKLTKLSFELMLSKHPRLMYRLSWFMSKMKVNSRDKRIRAGLKGTELNMLPTVIKGIVHPNISFLSLFTHSHVVPNLYSFLSLC